MQSFVPIKFLPGTQLIFLRELCGKDEMIVSGTNSLDAIKLLDSIIKGEKYSVNGEFKAEYLTVADRDRVLRVIFQNTYGNKIYSTEECSECEIKYDIDFTLDNLIKDIEPKPDIEYSIQDKVYVFSVNGGTEFRLPTGVDEFAILGMGKEEAQKELISRCVLKGNFDQSVVKIEKAMEDVAPLIDHVFKAKCPECEQKQEFHFNLQRYLLSSLLQEKQQLALEVSTLSTSYSWGLTEILELPRSQRRSYINILNSG